MCATAYSSLNVGIEWSLVVTAEELGNEHILTAIAVIVYVDSHGTLNNTVLVATSKQLCNITSVNLQVCTTCTNVCGSHLTVTATKHITYTPAVNDGHHP